MMSFDDKCCVLVCFQPSAVSEKFHPICDGRTGDLLCGNQTGTNYSRAGKDEENGFILWTQLPIGELSKYVAY